MLALVRTDLDRAGARRFVEALGDATAAAWLDGGEVARLSAAAREVVVEGVFARAEKLGVSDDLWQLADGVDTAAWYVLPEWCRAPRNASDGRTRKFCIEAARLTAYAVLLRAYLAAPDFELLSAPFREIVSALTG